MNKGQVGQSYNIGGRAERTNLQVVEAICALLDAKRPLVTGRGHCELISFVDDRPGHDRRYAIDYTKLSQELGYQPSVTFEDGLKQTIDWYKNNPDWWQPYMENFYVPKFMQADGATEAKE